MVAESVELKLATVGLHGEARDLAMELIGHGVDKYPSFEQWQVRQQRLEMLLALLELDRKARPHA